MNMNENALKIIKDKDVFVIAGGGVLGIAEVGSLCRLRELGGLTKIKSISGSSVGSIISTGLACGATVDYMKDLMFNLNLNKFHDNNCIIKDIYKVFKNWGANRTKEIDRLARKILDDLVGNSEITFKELYERTGIHLTITYLSLNYDRTMYADHINNPDSLVREKIVKSSSIPFFYEPYSEGNGVNKLISVDGGVANNYPMNIPKEQGYQSINILGLKLIGSDDVDHIDNGGSGTMKNLGAPKNIIDFGKRIINILRDQALRLHVHKDDWKLTVKINIGTLSSTDFDLSNDQKKWLFDQGVRAMDKYVEDLTQQIIQINK